MTPFTGPFFSGFLPPALELPNGLTNSLHAKLVTAKRLSENLGGRRTMAVRNVLRAFINQVRAQRGKKIVEADADELISAAQGIIDLTTVD